MKFEQKGFPIIHLSEDSFKVKAIDYWEFRTFRYDEVASISYGKHSINYALWPLLYSLHEHFEPMKLQFRKKNGGSWTYDCPAKENSEFSAFITEIQRRCLSIG